MRQECSTVSFTGQVILFGIDVHVKNWNVSIRHARHQPENFSVKPDPLGLVGHFAEELSGQRIPECALSWFRRL